MAGKLELTSIAKRIHWPLLIKAAAFGFSWFLLPFWLFLAIGIYFYFMPLFRPKDLAFPFAALIFFAYTEERSLLLAILFAALFYLIIGVKDLILINRQSAKEILALLFALFLAVKFFSSADNWSGLSVLGYSFVASVFVFFLAKLFIRSDSASGNDEMAGKKTTIALLAASFFIWQLFLSLVYLPLNFLYQSAIFIVTATIFLELISDHIRSALTKRKILLQFSIFLVFAATILVSAQWAL